MKKIFKNALFGVLLGLINIPLILMELYYFGNNDAYLLEVVYYKNFQNIIITTVLYGFTFGIILTLPTFLKEVKFIKNVDIKNVLQMFITVVLVTIMIYIIPFFKLSETVNALIILNTVITVIISMISVLVYNSIQIRKINKKIKE